MDRPAKEAYSRHCRLLICGCKGNNDVPRGSRKIRRHGIHLATQLFIIEIQREDFEVKLNRLALAA